MTRDAIKAKFPRASEAFIRANLDADVAAQAAANTPIDMKHGNSKSPAIKNCPSCGRLFEVSPPSQAPLRKYCSNICKYGSTDFKEAVGSKLRKVRGNSICKKCGKEFELTRNSGKGEFCSQICAASLVGKFTIRKNRISENCHSRGKTGWKEVGGERMFFRSRWEANYAHYLEFLKGNNQIQKWEHEPETFWFESIKRGVRSYLPDFRVTENSGCVVFHEVKGWMDPKSITKLKRMKQYHPNVNMFVADSVWYRANAKKLKAIVKGWQ